MHIRHSAPVVIGVLSLYGCSGVPDGVTSDPTSITHENLEKMRGEASSGIGMGVGYGSGSGYGDDAGHASGYGDDAGCASGYGGDAGYASGYGDDAGAASVIIPFAHQEL